MPLYSVWLVQNTCCISLQRYCHSEHAVNVIGMLQVALAILYDVLVRLETKLVEHAVAKTIKSDP